MKKNMAITMFLVGFLVMTMFSACGKPEGPTTPVVPNSFKITDVRELCGNDLLGDYSILCLYTNATKDLGYVIGMISYGDGATENFPDFIQQLAANTFNRELDMRPLSNGHWYSAPGTYHVKVDLTARFSNGSITASFEKDFVITK